MGIGQGGHPFNRNSSLTEYLKGKFAPWVGGGSSQNVAGVWRVKPRILALARTYKTADKLPGKVIQTLCVDFKRTEEMQDGRTNASSASNEVKRNGHSKLREP
jgi:hypothetical protein